MEDTTPVLPQSNASVQQSSNTADSNVHSVCNVGSKRKSFKALWTAPKKETSAKKEEPQKPCSYVALLEAERARREAIRRRVEAAAEAQAVAKAQAAKEQAAVEAQATKIFKIEDIEAKAVPLTQTQGQGGAEETKALIKRWQEDQKNRKLKADEQRVELTEMKPDARPSEPLSLFGASSPDDMEGLFEYPPSHTMTAEERARHRQPKRKASSPTAATLKKPPPSVQTLNLASLHEADAIAETVAMPPPAPRPLNGAEVPSTQKKTSLELAMEAEESVEKTSNQSTYEGQVLVEQDDYVCMDGNPDVWNAGQLGDDEKDAVSILSMLSLLGTDSDDNSI